MYIDVVNQDTFLDPHVVEDLYKPLPQPPPPHKETPHSNSMEIIPTGWDVDPATSGATIPIFISAGDDQSPAEHSSCGLAENPTLQSNAILEPVSVVPTGWGDEEDVGSSNAWKVDHKDVNFGNMNYSSWGIRNESSWEQSEHWNRTKYGKWGNGRGVGRRFSLKPAAVIDEKGYYRMNDELRGFHGRRKKYTDEYFYLHGCAPGYYHR